MNKGIYVEIFINAPVETVWAKTQTPDEHVKWDLRFTDIDYLPRPNESEPQRFLYQTRIGFGKAIRGEGETVGKRENDSSRSSALKFWSKDPKSLIQEGAGYWKYIPTHNGTIFLTWYDYRTRFGFIGRVFDSIVFKPLMGWATAWSFDRLRLWIEKGIPPAVSFQKSLLHGLARCAVAFIWLYHGLVPKLLFKHPDEAKMLTDAGISTALAWQGVSAAGVAEVLFGITLLLTWSIRWPLLISVPLMVAAIIGVSIHSPAYLVGAFNPVTLNLSVVVLSLIAYIAGNDIPLARRCLRKPQ